jgi:hypothetical protein
MDWDATKDFSNEDILNVFSVPVIFDVNGIHTSTSGVFMSPADKVYGRSSRDDDHELSGADGRRSTYELEILSENIPSNVEPGVFVEIHSKRYVVSFIDPPDGNSTVIHLNDTGEVV